MARRLSNTVQRLDKIFHYISCAALFAMAVVTLTDITMRAMGSPIVGSLEIVTFLGAVVIGFALPYTSWMKGHVYVDILVDKLSPGGRNILMGVTRCMGIFLFIFLGLDFVIYGVGNIRSGEVTPAFRIPVYPIAFGLAASFFVQSFTLLAELAQILRGGQGD
jgi:TRAP-type C4-dicarboxylate transport system permease small subunit